MLSGGVLFGLSALVGSYGIITLGFAYGVGARNNKRPDAQWMVFSGAHYLRRNRASDAQSLRHNAKSVRRTRNRPSPAHARHF
jgi:hypothetical protein